MAASISSESQLLTLLKFLVLELVMILLAIQAAAADPDITTDFGIDVTSGSQLLFSGFEGLPTPGFKQFQITFGFNTEFPGVIGTGVAPAYLQFGPGSINNLHVHPRGSEIFYVIEGELEAGVTDTANQLFTATLKEGSTFVFPKGLLHYQVNKSKTKLARVIAVFNSANPGRLTIPLATFSTVPPIPTPVLEQAFNLDEATIEKLKRTQFQGAGREIYPKTCLILASTNHFVG